VGTDGVPRDVSLTNAVQVTVWPVITEDGEHITAVEVVLGPTVTVLLAVGPLPLWAASVDVYVPLAMTVPCPVGVNVTEQLEAVVLTLASVQGEPVNDPVADPLFVNDTVPAGAEAVPAIDVSVTVAEQLTDWPIATELGEHVTAVDVVLRFTVTVLPAVGPLPL